MNEKIGLSKETNKARSVETLFRNAARSNLELTSLADSKASILISVNGFILTVIVTASGLQLNHPLMIYPFISIILTSLAAIFFATKAIQPRYKKHFIHKDYLEDHNSILYFQDMVSLTPEAYLKEAQKVIQSTDLTRNHIIKHLHILGSELQVKYHWLRLAYITFTIGLIISMFLVIYVLINMIPAS